MRYALSTMSVLCLVICVGACGDGGKTKKDGAVRDAPVSLPDTYYPLDAGVQDLPVWPDTAPADAPIIFPDTVSRDQAVTADASGPPPTNDTCASAQVLTWSGSPLSIPVDTRAATDNLDLGSASCTGDVTSGKDVFFEIQLPPGSYDIVLKPASSDMALYVLSGCSITDCIVGSDNIGTGLDEMVSVMPSSTTTYIIGVDAWDPSEAGPCTLEVTAATSPPDGGVDGPPPPDSMPIDGPVSPDAPLPIDTGPAPDGPVPPDGSTTAPKVVVTEIMADPSASGTVTDTNGEWFELYNAGSTTVNLKNWQITDQPGSSQNAHTIGADLLIQPGQYVVLTRNGNTSVNGGVTSAYTYSSFFLANGTDEIFLYDNNGNLIDKVEYGVTGWPAVPTGASLSLKNPSMDNNVGANWCPETACWLSTTPCDKGTPGAAAGTLNCP
jgi:hypothetical protein